MLSKIELENFKCFQGRTAFPLSKLTLLTGVNGCGKSTFLQSLLLMRQSIEHSHTTNQIVLNGKCINLNSFNEVRNTNTSRNENVKFKYYYHYLPIEKSTYTLSGFVEYTLFENVEDDMVAQIKSIEFDDNVLLNTGEEECTEYKIRELYNYTNTDLYTIEFDYNRVFSISRSNTFDEEESKGSSIIMDLIPVNYFNKVHNNSHRKIDFSLLNSFLSFSRIHYISADRLGPQDSYFKYTLTSFPNVGAKGEQTVNLLYKKKDDLVYEKLCLGQDAKTLATQTEEWLNQIFDGAKVEIPSSQSNIIELLLNTSTSKDRFKPANVGFGYHCVLPIVVSGLIAKEGEMLIVENPEAHLHPRAQSRLAQFLAKVSSCGVQVFIETHSDHILNALRIAVLDKIITPDDLSILYFQRNAEQPVVQIPIQPNGGIEEWPEGFFDQMDKDFSRLFGI